MNQPLRVQCCERLANVRAAADEHFFDGVVASFFGGDSQNTGKAVQRVPFNPFQQGDNPVLPPFPCGFKDDGQAGRSGMTPQRLCRVLPRKVQVGLSNRLLKIPPQFWRVRIECDRTVKRLQRVLIGISIPRSPATHTP